MKKCLYCGKELTEEQAIHSVYYWDGEKFVENDIHEPKFMCIDCANTPVPTGAEGWIRH